MELAGKLALITGGSRGIGFAIAQSLGAAGCRVALVSRTQSDLLQATDRLTALGISARGFPCDLGSRTSLEAMHRSVVETWSAPDILVNNAGVLHVEEIETVTTEGWLDTFSVNLTAPFLLAQACIPSMKERGEGYIINLSSTVAFGTPAHLPSYGISKHGVKGLSEALWDHVRGSGIKVSTVYPGITDTRMVREIDSGDPEEWMKPEDIAQCVLFLLQLSPRIIVKEVVPWATRRDRI